MKFPTQQRQQAYDPMARMMQILQLVMQQNQQGQQQENQDRSFGLEERQLDMQSQRYDQQFAAQQAAQQQQEQQAIISVLSRVENKDGFQDPTALYQYLQQRGIQIPGMEQMQQPQVPVDPQLAGIQAMLAQPGQ